MPIKEILPDGTRVYTKGHRYRPLDDDQRVYRRLKPENAEELGYRHWHGVWLPPLPVIPDDERTQPWTVSDKECSTHELGCLCHGCRTSKKARYLKRKRLNLTLG